MIGVWAIYLCLSLFLLALLGSVLRYDLVRANALKVVAVGGRRRRSACRRAVTSSSANGLTT